MHLLAQGQANSSGLAEPATTTVVATSTPRATTTKATSTSIITVPVATPTAPVVTPSSANYLPQELAGGVVALIALASIAWVLRKNKQDNQGDDKCDSIKALLEEKKQEMKDMIKDWPKDKFTDITEGKVLGRERKERYDKLKEAIETLQTKFDLCMLSLPDVVDSTYTGTIVENTLVEKKILKNLEILKTKQMGDWTLHKVSVNEKQIMKLSKVIMSGPWYMHFWKEDKDTMLVVFRDKIFPIKYKDKSTWGEAVAYGKSIGVPGSELDFKVI